MNFTLGFFVAITYTHVTISELNNYAHKCNMLAYIANVITMLTNATGNGRQPTVLPEIVREGHAMGYYGALKSYNRSTVLPEIVREGHAMGYYGALNSYNRSTVLL